MRQRGRAVRALGTALAATGGVLGTQLAAAQYVAPYKMTFASADPEGALAFAVRYLGAVEHRQPHKGGNGTCALIKWCTFPGTNTGASAPGHPGGEPYQFHFVKGYHRPNGSMTIDDFEARMEALHGGLTEYDQFMDFHVTMRTTDLDPLASALVRDGVPVLTRAAGGGLFSLFFELPHAIVVEVVAPRLTVLRPSAWARCGAPRRGVFDARRAAARRPAADPLPLLQPLRAVYASTDPAAAAAFIATYFGGELVTDPAAAPGAGNGTCYDARAVRWVGGGGDTYEMVWIHSPTLRQGALDLAQFEAYLRTLHGDMRTGTYDEYMDFHIGLTFNNSDPLMRRLDADGVPYFMRGQYGRFADVFIEGPGGQVYEVLGRNQTVEKDIPSWDLCGPV